ncbi:CBS domain-containing protein [Persephonella atlantica]|uniref:Zinc metalloprotease n=1 Tax=Persephonella atlantica TaxID=2699429 RepID=A0ABS1GJF7_9AQUI|nr:site-2 protease family protein [Persephonella atlantica]MBK3333068.1 CBS domain-containing protein [Persephonella atlantica]
MRFKSIPLFKIAGIQVNLDFSWFIVFFLISFTLAEYFYPHYYPDHSFLIYWFVGGISAILLFASVLLHELSHSLVAIRFGIPVREIDLFIFGGVAMIEEEAPSPKVEFLVAVAGPVCSFLLSFLFFVIALTYPQDDLFNGIINYLMLVNFALAVFNLVPAFPLDGGRILRSIIWAKKDLLTATKISSWTGTVFAYVLILFGILSLIQGNLVGAMWYGLLGLFLRNASKVSYEQTKLSVILSKYRVEQFMHTVKPVLPDETISEFMMYHYPVYKTSIFPVIGDDGKIYEVSIVDINRVPQVDWDRIRVLEVSQPVEVYVSPYDTLLKALRLMNRYQINELPVVYGNTVLGIIKRDVIESLIERYYIQEKLQES